MHWVRGPAATGAIATGTMVATSTSITRTTSTKITSTTSTEGAIELISVAEISGSIIHNTAAMLHTAIEERPTNLAVAAPVKGIGLVAVPGDLAVQVA